MKRKHLIILVAVLLIPVLFIGSCWHSMQKLTRGYETEPSEQYAYLDRILSDDLAYDGLREEWIESSWVNGFREHVHLYKLSMPAGELEILKECFRSGEEDGSDSSMENLRDGMYLGSSTAPDWWDTERLDSLPQLIHAGNQRDWRLTVSADSVYLLVHDW